MRALPFLDPDRNIYINLATLLILVKSLSSRSNKKNPLDVDRLRIFHFLIRNPVVSNRVLSALNAASVTISEENQFSVKSESPDMLEIFDPDKTNVLVKILLEKEYIKTILDSKGEITFDVTSKGAEIESDLNDQYFDQAKNYGKSFAQLHRISTKMITEALKNTMILGRP